MRIGFVAILARLLDKADFGIIAIAMIVVGFADLFTELGVGYALIQKEALSSDDKRNARTFTLFSGLLMGLLIFCFAPLIGQLLDSPEAVPVIRFLSLLTFITGLFVVPNSLLVRERRFKALSLIDLFTYSVGYGLVGVLLAWYGFGYWSLAYGILTQKALYLAILLYKTRGEFAFGYQRSTLVALLKPGSKISLAVLANYFALKVDYVIVSKFMGTSALGVYSRGYSLMNAPNMIISKVFNVVVFPLVASIQKNHEKVSSSIDQAYLALMYLMIPVTGFCVLNAADIIRILLGSKWGDVVPVFSILVLAMPFRFGYKLLTAFLKGVGLTKPLLTGTFLYFFLVLIGANIGARYSLPGVAVGVSVAIFCTFLYYALFIRFRYGATRILSVGVNGKLLFFATLVLLPQYLGLSFLTGQLNSSVLRLFVAGGLLGLSLLLVYVVDQLFGYWGFKEMLHKFKRNG